ncbi:MAG: molybdenum cofactor guanylyltransferase MobA [Pseudomonadaceae bacterium]
MSASPRISALLLAGGQGRRMGGADKGLLPYRGAPISAHLSQLLRSMATQLLISCNRNAEQYRQWADDLVTDNTADYPGPLAGILSGLRQASGEQLLVLPCDMPLIDQPLLQQLITSAHPDRPVFFRTGEQPQPLPCLIPRSALPALESAWQQGMRSPLRWLREMDAICLDLAADDARLTSANSPAQWQALH